MPTYRDTKGMNLVAAEVDANFREAFDAIAALEGITEEVAQIDDIVLNLDGSLTFILDDYREITTDPIPQSVYRPRGEWQPATVYSKLDLFHYAGAVYVTQIAHTSEASFDAGYQILGEDVYQILIPRMNNYAEPQAVDGAEVVIGLSMAGKWSYLTGAGGTNLIVPKDATVDHEIGAECHVFSTVFGQNVTFEAEDGTVSVLWDEECIPQFSGRYVGVTFKKITANVWHVVGSLALDPSV